MDASMMSQRKELQDENRRLKKMYAESQMTAQALREAMAKNGEAISTPADGPMGGKAQGDTRPVGCAALTISQNCYRYQLQALQ